MLADTKGKDCINKMGKNGAFDFKKLSVYYGITQLSYASFISNLTQVTDNTPVNGFINGQIGAQKRGSGDNTP